ncbi:hypothetical protein BDR05DRAFT_955512 [Suillus weaverae]|nr:hypothetical protein BDR05DRAFT_955512 [Suillus weaverae]
MTDDILFESLLTAPVPPGGTLLAAELQNLYGIDSEVAAVTSAHLLLLIQRLYRSSPWISASINDLARRLEKLNRTDVQRCICRSAPRYYRTLYNKLTRRKTCNACANYARQRALCLLISYWSECSG